MTTVEQAGTVEGRRFVLHIARSVEALAGHPAPPAVWEALVELAEAMHAAGLSAPPDLPSDLERRTFTIDETATMLGLGRTATYNAVRRGELPSIRFGRRVLVPGAALARLLASPADGDTR